MSESPNPAGPPEPEGNKSRPPAEVPTLEPTFSLGSIAQATDPGNIQSQVNDGTIEPLTVAEAYRASLDKAYPNVQLTSASAKRVRNFVQNMRMGGASGIILVCAGDGCQFRAACPLYAEKVHPLYEPCPLEAMVIMDTRNDLGQIVDLDAKNPIIRGHIAELTQVAVLMWRCQMKLAYDFHDVMQEVPAAVAPDGTVHTRQEATPLLEVLDVLSSRRSRLLKELAQTEEAKWRKKAALGEDTKDSLSRTQASRKQAIQAAQGILPGVLLAPSHVTRTGFPPSASAAPSTKDPAPESS